MPQDIKDIKLNTLQGFSEISLLADDIIAIQHGLNAYKLSKWLTIELGKISHDKLGNVDLYNNYQILIAKLRWIGFVYIADNEVVNLFKDNFVQSFELENFDIWQKLKARLITIDDYRDRDNLKNNIKKVLDRNETRLTKKAIISGQNSVPPTITNWIKDYVAQVGESKLDKAQYLFYSKNFINLDEEDKKKVKTLITLYEKLKIPSKSAKGLVETVYIDEGDGRRGVLNEGELEKINPNLIKELQQVQDVIDEVYGKKTAPVASVTEKVESKNEVIDKVGVQNTVPTPIAKKEIYFMDDVVRFDNTHTEDFASKLLSKSEKNLLAKPKEKVKIEAPEEVEKIPAPKKQKLLFAPGDLKEQMQKVLNGDLWQSEQIDAIKEQIHHNDGDDIKKLLNGFQQAKTAEQVIARLEYIAKTGHFKQLLSFIGLKYEELTPDNFVKVIKAFLEKRMDEKEIPRFAMRLAILLKKYGREDYMKAVYFDKKEQMFKWSI